VALAAVDGWGGDHAVAYEAGGRTCLQARLAGDSEGDTAELLRAFESWAAAGPPDVAHVAADDGEVALEACAPESVDEGAGSGSPTRSLDALYLVGSRSQIMLGAEQAGLDHAAAFTAADCFVRAFTFDEFLVLTPEDDRFAEAWEGCGLA
jgi:hypothetical protein